MSILKVKNLIKSFSKQKALDNLSFEIKPNKITGIVGPDGAGKTTLLRILSGLLNFEASQMEVLNLNLSSNIQKFKNKLDICPKNLDYMRI